MQYLIHQTDPTRPVTFAIYPHNETAIFATGIQGQMDVVGENYRPDDLMALWATNQNYKLIDTEENHDRARWVSVRDNPPLAGCFVWTGFDYLGETIYANGSQGWPYVICAGSDNASYGLMDIAGVMYPRGWQRMSWWSTKPMVHMVRYTGNNGTGALVSDWTPTNGYTTAKVQVYCNCQQAELFLNGNSLGAQSPPANAAPLTWTFAYAPGTLTAIGRNSGVNVATNVMQSAGAPDHLVLSADRTNIAPVFDDLANVSVTIVDANGVPCPNASNHLTFTLTGPGRIAALSTGDQTSHQPFQAVERDAFNGFCLALVKATNASGLITLTASAPGLASGSITIRPLVAFNNYVSDLGLLGADALPAARPFADGEPNLLRYAMNLGAAPAPNQLPTFGLTGDGFVTLQFRQRKIMDGVEIHVQTSTNLLDWSDLPAGQLVQLADDDPDTQRYEARVPITSGSEGFLRLEAVQSP